LLRQGEATREVADEFDLVDFDSNEIIGRLSLLMTNEGRRVPKTEMPTKPVIKEQEPEQLPASAPSHVSRTRKKIYSKPMELHECPNHEVDDSELERKQQRIARMRLQTINGNSLQQTFKQGQFGDEEEQEMMLVKIQKIREARKQQMMTMM